MLLVADDPVARYVIAHDLADRGVEVLVSEGGQAVLDRLEHHVASLDLLIADLTGPVLDGLELARQVRTERGQADLPILIAADGGGVAHRAEAERLGVALADTRSGPGSVVETATTLLILQGWPTARREAQPAPATDGPGLLRPGLLAPAG